MKFNELTQLTLLIESLSSAGFLMTETVKLARELQTILSDHGLKVPEKIQDKHGKVKEEPYEVELIKNTDKLAVVDGKHSRQDAIGTVLTKLFPDLLFDQNKLREIISAVKAKTSDDIEFTVEKDVVNAYTNYCIYSCMANKPMVYFYSTQPDISIVIARKDGKPVGRALRWSKVEGAKNGMFMDRVYPADNKELTLKFWKYADDNGWSHRKTQSATNTDKSTPMIYHIKNQEKLKDRRLPFLDTFRYGQQDIPKLSNTPKSFNTKYPIEFVDAYQGEVLFKPTYIDRMLYSAAEEGRLDTVKKLISDGVDIGINENYALRFSAARGHLEVVKVLLKAGADVHAQDDFAVRLAAYNGHLEVVKELAAAGADIHALDDAAFRITAGEGNIEVVKFFLLKGVDIHAGDDHALRTAAKNGHLEIVKVLIEAGADIESYRGGPLLAAATYNRPEIVKVLIDAGVDINARNSEAFRMALYHGHQTVIKMFLAAGADTKKFTNKEKEKLKTMNIEI